MDEIEFRGSVAMLQAKIEELRDECNNEKIIYILQEASDKVQEALDILWEKKNV
jgi:hypothetical protein